MNWGHTLTSEARITEAYTIDGWRNVIHEPERDGDLKTFARALAQSYGAVAFIVTDGDWRLSYREADLTMLGEAGE